MRPLQPFGQNRPPRRRLSNTELAIGFFVLAACIQLVYLLWLPLSLSIDSYAYIGYARNLLIPDPYIVRTPGYPALVALAGVPWLDSMLVLVSLQMVMAAAMPVLVFCGLRHCGRTAALIGAALATVFPYTYTMSLQVMSETAYLFGYTLAIVLLAEHLARGSTSWLLATVGVIAITAEVRPSASILHAAVPFAVGLRLLLTRNRTAGAHLAVALVLAVVAVSGRALITERNSSNIAPFFVWHWMARCQLADGRACVSTDNGPATRDLFAAVKQMLRERPDVYESMASVRDIRGAAAGIRQEFAERNDAAVDRLTLDLQTNTSENAHRGPAMVLALWSHLGVPTTGALLRPVVLETLVAHPDILKQIAGRFTRALFTTQNVESADRGIYVLHDNVYWYFVPHSLSERSLLDTFPGGPRLYAEWIDGLDRLTGVDPAAKQLSGHVPESWAEASQAHGTLGNRSALALYLGSVLTREMVKYVCVASVILAPLLFASNASILGVTAWLTFWGLILTSFVSQNTYRQILLHVPGLVFVVAIEGDGLARVIARLRHRDSAVPEVLLP